MLPIITFALLSSFICAAIIHAGVVIIIGYRRRQRMDTARALVLFPVPYFALAAATGVFYAVSPGQLGWAPALAQAVLRWAFCAAVSVALADACWKTRDAAP